MIRRIHLNRGIIAKINANEDVTLEEVDAEKDVKVAEKNADVQGRLEESHVQVYHLDLVHADKVLSMHDDEVEPAELTKVIKVVTSAKLMTEVVTAAATTITAAPSAARRRKGVVIRDPEKTSTPSIIHFNCNVAFLEKSEKELEEEASKALKRKSKSSKQQVAKKQKLDEEVEELKTHLKFIPNDEDDVYTEATPLALKPKNFSDDFLLNALKTMFEKPDVEAQVWKNQRDSYGLAKVKSWKMLESCGVHIITFTTTQMILLVERRYPLKRFTLYQMLNNVRLEVEEESEVSLKLLRFIRRQQQEGYRPE
nr:hypothetical protein [Tanacetum cinerariifolium]